MKGSKMIIGYQGEIGGNSEAAARVIAQECNLTDAQFVPMNGTTNLMAALARKTVDYGVFAMQSNTDGAAEETLAASRGISMRAIGRTVLDIHHCLFKKPGVKNEDLRHVASHPQVFDQVKDTLAREFAHLDTMDAPDTATCAQWLAKGLLSENVAVICRKNAGLDLGLQLVQENLEDSSINVEFRMICIAEAEPVSVPQASRLLKLMKKETLTQVALLQSLSQGDYTGSISVGDLKHLGDTGIGTFDKLDGELIMLDGQVYQALSNGMVVIPPDDLQVPFADVTYMDADIYFDLEGNYNMSGLAQTLTNEIASYNANLFYMAVIKCTLDTVTVRSAVLNYKDKDASLASYMEDNQRSFDYENISGTLVALYCPPFMSGLNLPGWHFHFLSEDCTLGGHVMSLTLTKCHVTLDQTRVFNMVLPDDDLQFSLLDLTLDQSADLSKVESSED